MSKTFGLAKNPKERTPLFSVTKKYDCTTMKQKFWPSADFWILNQSALQLGGIQQLRGQDEGGEWVKKCLFLSTLRV